MGHMVRLIAPQFVKPYVKTNKNDAVDAEAICEAVAGPNMRYVPVKSIEQQSVYRQLDEQGLQGGEFLLNLLIVFHRSVRQPR
ncbi:transposase [Paraburkholderia sp. 35.1]